MSLKYVPMRTLWIVLLELTGRYKHNNKLKRKIWEALKLLWKMMEKYYWKKNLCINVSEFYLFKKYLTFHTSNLHHTFMLGCLVCTESLGSLVHLVVTAVMDAKELKATEAAQGRLDLRDLQASRELRVLKENLEYRVLTAKRGSGEKVGKMESRGLLVWCLLRTGRSARGATWMKIKTTAWLRWIAMILRRKIV